MRRKDREITDLKDMESVIRQSDCCHIALSDENRPYLVALSFGYCSGQPAIIYFHCAKEGKKLDIIRKNPAAFFFFDTNRELVRGEKACDWGMKFQSVAGSGTISFVTDRQEKKMALDSIMEHYSGTTSHEYDISESDRTEVLKLTVAQMTGKRKGP